MPIYERRCRRCSAKYSLLCKMEDRNKPDKCPGCGSPDTDPVLSATQTDFKFADKSARKGR